MPDVGLSSGTLRFSLQSVLVAVLELTDHSIVIRDTSIRTFVVTSPTKLGTKLKARGQSGVGLLQGSFSDRIDFSNMAQFPVGSKEEELLQTWLRGVDFVTERVSTFGPLEGT